MGGEQASSELIGTIMLIGLIVGAFGIFTALYIPSLIPPTLPQVKLSMACSNNTTDGNDIEYPCTRGSFNCHPFDNRTCEEDCKWRDYAENHQFTTDQQQREVQRCMENCMEPLCFHISDCVFLYVCHNGGDSLKLSDLRILVNGIEIPRDKWKIKQETTFISTTPGMTFRIGESLRINLSDTDITLPMDTVMITYTPPSGGEVTLTMNQFGTDVE